MPSGSCETQLLAPVLHTTQRKHALSDLGGVCIPHTFVNPHMFGHPPYVWMPPVHTQYKESIHFRLRGCLYAPIHLYALCMFKCLPICLDAPICLDSPHMFGYSICSDVTLYVWMPPYVWTPPICL